MNFDNAIKQGFEEGFKSFLLSVLEKAGLLAQVFLVLLLASLCFFFFTVHTTASFAAAAICFCISVIFGCLFLVRIFLEEIEENLVKKIGDNIDGSIESKLEKEFSNVEVKETIHDDGVPVTETDLTLELNSKFKNSGLHFRHPLYLKVDNINDENEVFFSIKAKEHSRLGETCEEILHDDLAPISQTSSHIREASADSYSDGEYGMICNLEYKFIFSIQVLSIKNNSVDTLVHVWDLENKHVEKMNKSSGFTLDTSTNGEPSGINE